MRERDKLLEYFENNRRVGHTKSMLAGAEKSDCLVIVSNRGTTLGLPAEKVVALEDLVETLDKNNKPILIDNEALKILMKGE